MGWICSNATLLFMWQLKKVSEDIGGTHELSASSSLFDVALTGPQKISVAVGLLLPVGSK